MVLIDRFSLNRIALGSRCKCNQRPKIRLSLWLSDFQFLKVAAYVTTGNSLVAATRTAARNAIAETIDYDASIDAIKT